MDAAAITSAAQAVHQELVRKLAEQARIMAGAGAEVVYVTDSAGALLPDEAEARVAALREALPGDVEVGFHGSWMHGS